MDKDSALLLRLLPEADPPAHLWARIARQQRRQRRRQQASRVVGAMAMAAVLCLAVGLLPRPLPAPDQLSFFQRQSHELELQYGGRAAHAQIRTIDRELQAAYQRNARPGELEQLWRMRNHYLRHAMLPPQAHSALARI